jgi:hypothetical protein
VSGADRGNDAGEMRVHRGAAYRCVWPWTVAGARSHFARNASAIVSQLVPVDSIDAGAVCSIIPRGTSAGVARAFLGANFR